MLKKILIIGMLSSVFIGLSFVRCAKPNPRIEETALLFLINVLNDSSFYKNSDERLLIPGFEEDMRFFDQGNYYTNGKLCLFSTPYYLDDDSIIGYARANLNEMIKSRDSLARSNYQPIQFSIPSIVNQMNYKEYVNSHNENSYFFTIKHHLKGLRVSLVQIHVTPYSKSDNPFEYSFHIYLDENKVIEMKMSLEMNFEYEIDC